MGVQKIIAGQVVRIVEGRNAGQAGRVKKINVERQTVALEVGGKVGWYAVSKLGPLHG